MTKTYKNKKVAECGKVTDTIIVPSSLHFLGAFTGAYFLILGSKKWGVCIQRKVTIDRAKVPSRKGCCIRESWNSPAKDWCIGSPWRVMRSQVTPSFFTRKTSSFSFKLVVLGILMNHFLRNSGATRQRNENSWSRSIQSWKYALNLSGVLKTQGFTPTDLNQQTGKPQRGKKTDGGNPWPNRGAARLGDHVSTTRAARLVCRCYAPSPGRGRSCLGKMSLVIQKGWI